VSRLRGFNHWFTSVTPFRLAEQALGHLVVLARLAFVAAAPALARASGVRLPPASSGLLRQPDVGALSSPFDSWRLVAHNAVVTRTSPSLASRLTFASQQPVWRGGGASATSAQPARYSRNPESPAQDHNPALTLTTSMPGDPLSAGHGAGLLEEHRRASVQRRPGMTPLYIPAEWVCLRERFSAVIAAPWAVILVLGEGNAVL
jgi:hypothetical protein